MRKLLNKPYPYFNSFIENITILSCVSIFVVLFIWVFKPFNDIIELTHPRIAGYGAITFLIAFTTFFGLPKISPNFHSPENWTVGKEIFRLTIVILFISIGNYFYSIPMLIKDQDSLLSSQHLFRSFSTTASIGTIPIVIIVLYNQNRLLKKHIKESLEINSHISEQPLSKNNTITIKGEGKNEKCTLNSNEIIYIKSDGNYCEIITKNNKLILRTSLINIEQQLNDLDIFIKVHRSFIVNSSLINHVSGNAQGYKIHFFGCKDDVPVSRNNSEKIKHLFQ